MRLIYIGHGSRWWLLRTPNFFSYLYATGADLFNSASSSTEGRSILHFIIGATSSLSHRLKVGCRQLTHSSSSSSKLKICFMWFVNSSRLEPYAVRVALTFSYNQRWRIAAATTHWREDGMVGEESPVADCTSND
ncbi:hypothetical protein L2E82_36398 [Cichorium intybus]|uniref:Uncharacterized protein n=1 Tax=Cichorium intybus TaxID=13427 RepID=A0ACB9BRL5_CICIN|nr:hypothetical protein L2E82_36398 [Cichorium intybus]